MILYFNEFVLDTRLGDILGAELCDRMQGRVMEYAERDGLAHHRLEQWMKQEWPAWDENVDDMPEEFGGTLDCPVCRQSFFVVGYHAKPFCFHCNTRIDGDTCEECGFSFLLKDGCCCGHHKPQKNEEVPE